MSEQKQPGNDNASLLGELDEYEDEDSDCTQQECATACSTLSAAMFQVPVTNNDIDMKPITLQSIQREQTPNNRNISVNDISGNEQRFPGPEFSSIDIFRGIPHFPGIELTNTPQSGFRHNQIHSRMITLEPNKFEKAAAATRFQLLSDSPRRFLPAETKWRILENPESEDTAQKRELRLMKNRDAAKECRKRKKEYVKCLETRVNVLEYQNKQLIEELRTLKELYVHKKH